MAVHASEFGFRFEYPDAWTLVEEPGDERVVVTVSSGDTTFWSLALLLDGPAPEEALDAVVLAFEEEFGEVDVHSSSGKLAGQKAEFRTMEFVCWDLTNTAIAAAVRHGDHTLLLLNQFTDSEQAEVEQTLHKITKSLKLTGERAS